MAYEEKKVYDTVHEANRAFTQDLADHREILMDNYRIFGDSMKEILCFDACDCDELENSLKTHDMDKMWDDIFCEYRRKSFPVKGERPISEYEFNRARMLHTQRNQHHFEHWLFYDILKDKAVLYDATKAATAEIVLDWMTDCAQEGKNVYDWYFSEGRKTHILSKKTKTNAEQILECLHDKIDLTYKMRKKK